MKRILFMITDDYDLFSKNNNSFFPFSINIKDSNMEYGFNFFLYLIANLIIYG